MNGKIEKFEDIVAWQKSKDMTLSIYNYLKDCRDYSFKDQLQRASVSVMNNIAEGYEKRSDKDFRRYLLVAKASCAEVRSMLYLAKELHYLSESQAVTTQVLTVDVSKLLFNFIKRLE